MNQVLSSAFLKSVVHSVIVDQPCGAVQVAEKHGLAVHVFDEGSNEAFCARLADYLDEHEIDYIISFYLEFYSQALREKFQDRIINFHPSLLPAFKGMDGFGDGVAYHTKIIGTTVELIKDVMDEGKIVMQTACRVDPGEEQARLRHRIFVQQCKTLLQVTKWICEDRIKIDGDCVTIEGAAFGDLEFVPALEFDAALGFNAPFPGD